ncbi:(E3-independent) E2 ubiquitin-conjugating enzyme UBE2O-like isoform X1 [Tachypleus tridentatus]|uniref:(E3-independent) E2 ubiquitin-conjugating enzyme UBE2O-like isoform X1 n=1 Tax=Tachypleus tridentatus TaxID=6853 RepID=UPI003FD63D4B
MASTCKYFDEDAVYRINKKGIIEFGLVLENSEFVSSDEEEDLEHNIPEWERMKRGHVRIAWHPKGREEVLPEKRMKLLDRSLMPGDVVRKLVKGKDTQLGYCRTTNVQASVQVLGTKQVITGVNSKDLTPLEEFSSDIAVFLDSWVGMVKSVKSEIISRTSDGSRCVLSEEDAIDLDDILDKRDVVSEFRRYSFYPGQQLWGPSHCLKNAKWLHTTKDTQSFKPSSFVRLTVESVHITSMEVQWLCRAFSSKIGCDAGVEQPQNTVEGDDLRRVKMMHVLEPCALQIGDRNFYVVKETDRILPLDEWQREISHRLCPENVLEIMKSEPEETQQSVLEMSSQVDQKAYVPNKDQKQVDETDSEFEDVDDDDVGCASDSASMTSLSTASSVEKTNAGIKHKAKRGPTLVTKMLKKKKLKKARRKLRKRNLLINVGDKVVTDTLVTETSADVVWQDGSVESQVLSSDLYPVHHLDGHEFFPGDFVVENKDDPKAYQYGVVKYVDHTGRTALVSWMKTYTAGADPHPIFLSEQEVSVYDIKDHPDFKYRPGCCVVRVANYEDDDPASTAGQVVDIHSSGKVEVVWVNGKSSFCYPQELYRVGEYDSDDLWDDDDDDDEYVGSEESWETESENSVVEDDSIQGDEKHKEEGKEGKEKAKEQKESKQELKTEANVDISILREKLLSNIEKMRSGMARLEEVFTQNPTLQTSTVMRKLLELYKHCKTMDQILGTKYFHEPQFQSLVDKLRQRGRVNSAQHMADQILRLFSGTEQCNECSKHKLAPKGNDTESENVLASRKKDVCMCKLDSELESVSCSLNNIYIPVDTSEGSVTTGQVTSLLPQSGGSMEPRNVCRTLCALLKSRLLKAHQDVERWFGMSSAALATVGRSSPAQEKVDIDVEAAKEAVYATKTVNGTCTIQDVDFVDQTVNTKSAEYKDENLGKENSDLQSLHLSINNSEFNVVSNSKSKTEILELEKNQQMESQGPRVISTIEKLEPEEILEDIRCIDTAGQGIFALVETVPSSHKFKLSILQPNDPKTFFKTVKNEMELLRSSLPEGIIVKAFEDRMDLYSVMIKGPKRTPYEDGLFFFDVQLPADYPNNPPFCHYISYCSDRLNPNLYEGGKVCVSLLGTWAGKGTEVWSSKTSNLLQVIVSIQGLILVAEPYYNEAGYERQRGTQQGKENSRMYNEMVILKLIQALTRLIQSPHEAFKEEIMEHSREHAPRMIQRLEMWLEVSEAWNSTHPMTPTSPTAFWETHKKNGDLGESLNSISDPEFPLLPGSKGFCLTLHKSLAFYKEVLLSANILVT